MAANITIYCLENITDYFEFERLCHDLMALDGYSSIEPLGGFSDKGRDAIHISKSDETTLFAYSVREDWRAKLAEDAGKIRKHGHTCDQLVFITTARFTAGERDEAVAYTRNEFGWRLELFGIERIRILLETTHPQVKASHPQIFPPEFLVLQAQIDTSSKRDHLFISCVPEDGVLADWLTRRLTAEGYLIWCERFKRLGGETYPDDIDDVIQNRTFRFLGLYSQASLKNPEVMRERILALNIAKERKEDFFIPLNVDGVSTTQLDRVTSQLKFISCENDWAFGLRQLLEKLKSIDCPKPLHDGQKIAAEAFFEQDVLSDQTETLFSNCLQIKQIPKVIHRFKAQQAIPEERLEELKLEWAYRKVDSDTFLSFHQPPGSIMNEYQMKSAGGASWPDVENINRIWSPNLVSELLRKALIVKCHQKGLQYCPETKLQYFPQDIVEGDRLKYTRPDGSRTFVNACGQRKFWRPAGSEEYRYSLAPTFSVTRNLSEDFTVLVRIKIRFSNTKGALLQKQTAVSRRKHLCKDWWNDDWLNRVLAVCQFFADEGKITLGEREEQIVVDATLLQMTAPIGIDEATLDRLDYERSELLAMQEDDNSEEDIDESESEDE